MERSLDKDRKALTEDLCLTEMAIPSKDSKKYEYNIKLEKLSVFLKKINAGGKAKIEIMESETPVPDLDYTRYTPIIKTASTILNKEFGARYEYLIGLVYVPAGTKNGIYSDSNDEWIFFNKYVPFAIDKIRKMSVAAAGDVMKQTHINEDKLEQYRLATILFPIRKLTQNKENSDSNPTNNKN